MLILTLAAKGFAAHEIPPAFGPHVNLKPADFAEAKSFRGRDRILGTCYN